MNGMGGGEGGEGGEGGGASDLLIFGAFGGELLVVAVGEKRRSISRCTGMCDEVHECSALLGLEF